MAETLATRRVFAYLRLADPPASVLTIFISTLLFGYLMRLAWLEAAVLATIYALLTAALNSLNSITDALGDRISWPGRPLPLRTTSHTAALSFVGVTMGGAVALLVALSAVRYDPLAVVTVVIDLALIAAYSVRPLRLKAIPFGANLALTIHGLTLPLLASWSLSGFAPFPLSLLVFTMVDGWGTAVVKDFSDIAGNRILGDWTAPTSFGAPRARIAPLGAYIGAAGLALVFWVQDGFHPMWLTILPPQGGLILLAFRLVEEPRVSRRIYAGTIILSFLAGMIILFGLASRGR